jgi:hypothetical protein
MGHWNQVTYPRDGQITVVERRAMHLDEHIIVTDLGRLSILQLQTFKPVLVVGDNPLLHRCWCRHVVWLKVRFVQRS